MVGKTAENCGLPTISILTPLYNTPENYLREFLDSFVNQTAPNGQLCLADASDDAHPEVERVVREYQQKNQRIVYKKVENKGIAANTNAAETLATGEYLALADHDDVLAPHAMYAMGKAVLQLREKGEPDSFLYSDEALFTKDIKKPMVGHFKPDYAPDYLLCCNYICHLAVFKRGEALFAPQLRIIEILRDLAEPHAHAALAPKVVEGVHRTEKRLTRQLLGDALAPGQRKQIPVHVVEVHGVHLFKIRQRPHPLLSIRRRKIGFLTKKSVPRDGFFLSRFDDLFLAALRARECRGLLCRYYIALLVTIKYHYALLQYLYNT